MFQLTVISVVLFATTIINLFATSISWQRRSTKGGGYFALGMLGITVWTLAAGFDYAAVPISLKVFFAKIESIGYNSAIAFFTMFALSYAGYDSWLDKNWIKGVFAFVPLSNILLTLTNELHGLIWSGFRQSESDSAILIFEHGPGFAWVTLTGYVMVVALIVTVWIASRRGSELSRRQARFLLFASLFPVAANLVYLLEIPGFEGIDWSSITFSVSGILFLLALYGTRFLDLAPIARHAMIEQMRDCVLVLDRQDRLLDFNPAAQKYFGTNPNHLGRHIDEVMKDWPEIREISSGGRHFASRVTILHSIQSRVFDLRVTHMLDNRGLSYGKLMVFLDVTKRFHAEQALEERLREIQVLHDDLKKTQAQVLEQQRALAKVEERQRLGRDMHDSVNQSIHSLTLFSETLIALLEKDQVAKAIEAAHRIRESGRQALKEIRLLLYETQSHLVDENSDFVNALEERLNKVERRVGINAEIICEAGSMQYSPPGWNENLYWMIIEALNNSLKHAKARSIKIGIDCTPDELKVEIADDGEGFDASDARGGFGMRTMRERAQILGGQLRVQSSGHGSVVSFFARIGAGYGSHKNPDRG